MPQEFLLARIVQIFKNKRLSCGPRQLQANCASQQYIQNIRLNTTPPSGDGSGPPYPKNTIWIPQKQRYTRRATLHPQSHLGWRNNNSKKRKTSRRPKHHPSPLGLGKSLRQNTTFLPLCGTRQTTSTPEAYQPCKNALHFPYILCRNRQTQIHNTRAAHRHKTRLPTLSIPIPACNVSSIHRCTPGTQT